MLEPPFWVNEERKNGFLWRHNRRKSWMQDIILGGRITVNVPERKVEYRKAFRLPGQNGILAVYGNCGYRDRRLDPNVAVQLEFGADSGYDSSLPDSHTDAVWLGNTWGVRQQVSLGKGIGFEVCGGITMPTPSASYSYGSGMLAIGEGAIRLHVAEVNAVLNIE